jgi:hypothetical protein
MCDLIAAHFPSIPGPGGLAAVWEKRKNMR